MIISYSLKRNIKFFWMFLFLLLGKVSIFKRMFYVLLGLSAQKYESGSFSFKMNNNDVDKDVYNVIESISSDETKCFSELRKKLQQYCMDIDAKRRLSISIHIMKCELEKDGRYVFDDTIEDENFLLGLSEEQYHLYTSLWLSLESICAHLYHSYQYSANIGKVNTVYKTLGLSGEFLSVLSDSIKNQTFNIRGNLSSIKAKLIEQHKTYMQLNNLLVQAFKNYSIIQDQIMSFNDQYTNGILYLKTTGLSLCMTLIIPNFFSSIVCITVIFLYIDSLVVGYNFSYLMKIIRSLYVLITLIIFAKNTIGNPSEIVMFIRSTINKYLYNKKTIPKFT